MNVRILFILSILFFTGCASNPMALSPQQELRAAQRHETQVVFMRSSFVGSAISASLYDVTDGDIKFIGVLVNGTKVTYNTNPGKHVFMVVSEAADFMEANLDSGKNYFSIATPRMGLWAARFSLWPIKNDPSAEFNLTMPEFNNWLSDTKLMNNSEKSLNWYQANKETVRKKYEKYWPAWQQKNPAEIAQRTLSPSDGR